MELRRNDSISGRTGPLGTPKTQRTPAFSSMPTIRSQFFILILQLAITDLEAVQKGSDTRRALKRRAEAYAAVRCSEGFERSEAYEPFSTADLIANAHGIDNILQRAND